MEVDQIYHLACPASPVHYQYNAIKTLKTNILGTMHMCGLAKRVKARILLASTSEVYGDPDVHPQVEEYHGNVNCIGTRSCYDEGKRAAETLSGDFFREGCCVAVADSGRVSAGIFSVVCLFVLFDRVRVVVL